MNTIITTELATKFLARKGLSLAEGADAVETALAVSGALKSQSACAAFLINVREGAITPAELTEALAKAFPNDKVGDRHGAHYASLSRTGKLKGAEYAVAKSQGAGTRSDTTTELAKYKAAFAALESAKNMKEVREIVASLSAE